MHSDSTKTTKPASTTNIVFSEHVHAPRQE